MRCWSRAAAIKASPCAPQGRGTYSCSERLVGRTAPSPRGRWAAPLLLPEHRKAHLPLLHTYVVSPRTVNQGDPKRLCLRADDQH